MNFKTTALCIALVPALAMLGACNKSNDNDGDDLAPAATAPADTMPADHMVDQTMPADSMSSDGMASDSMGDNMAGASMAGDGMSFAQMDKNGDGGISKDELMPGQMLYDHFSVADADGNGVLSEAEVSKHRADMAAAPTQ